MSKMGLWELVRLLQSFPTVAPPISPLYSAELQSKVTYPSEDSDSYFDCRVQKSDSPLGLDRDSLHSALWLAESAHVDDCHSLGFDPGPAVLLCPIPSHSMASPRDCYDDLATVFGVLQRPWLAEAQVDGWQHPVFGLP